MPIKKRKRSTTSSNKQESRRKAKEWKEKMFGSKMEEENDNEVSESESEEEDLPIKKKQRKSSSSFKSPKKKDVSSPTRRRSSIRLQNKRRRRGEEDEESKLFIGTSSSSEEDEEEEDEIEKNLRNKKRLSPPQRVPIPSSNSPNLKPRRIKPSDIPSYPEFDDRRSPSRIPRLRSRNKQRMEDENTNHFPRDDIRSQSPPHFQPYGGEEDLDVVSPYSYSYCKVGKICLVCLLILFGLWLIQPSQYLKWQCPQGATCATSSKLLLSCLDPYIPTTNAKGLVVSCELSDDLQEILGSISGQLMTELDCFDVDSPSTFLPPPLQDRSSN